MLVNIAIADAYGASFEFKDKAFVDTYNTGTSYHTGESRVQAGHYTDDTQMSLAIAELLLEGKPWTRLNIAAKFLEVFKRDPRPGYAGGFYRFLQQTQTPEEFVANIIPTSTKSGAAMRSAPLGVLGNIEEIIAKSYLHASLTHNTEEGINSAVVVALGSHFFYHQLGEKKDLPTFIAHLVPGDWFTPWEGFASVEALDCARAALTAVMQSNSLEELLINSVSFTGDTDTVAAIALGIVNESPLFENNLSSVFHHGLENGEYGYDYLFRDQKELHNKYSKNFLAIV